MIATGSRRIEAVVQNAQMDARTILHDPSKQELLKLHHAAHRDVLASWGRSRDEDPILRGVSSPEGTDHSWGAAHLHSHYQLEKARDKMNLPAGAGRVHLYVLLNGNVVQDRSPQQYRSIDVKGIGNSLKSDSGA